MQFTDFFKGAIELLKFLEEIGVKTFRTATFTKILCNVLLRARMRYWNK